MKKFYFFTFALLCVYFNVFQAQISTVPESVGTSVSICQNGSVIFSSTNTPPAGATISWNFPGGTPSSANTLGPHPVSYSNPGSYTATLTINGVPSTVQVNVAVNTTSPDFNISSNLLQFGYGQNEINDSLPEFFYCGNLLGPYTGNVSFQFTIPSPYPANHQIIVNWGDGTHNVYAGNISSFNHTYDCSSQTEFSMSLSILGPDGCVAAGIYDVFSGISPQISVSGNASTHCIPDPYTFTFNSNNVPGTTYTYQFSDASDLIELNGPFPTTISYEFSYNSCDSISIITGAGGIPQTFQNSYAGNLIGTNVCGQSFLSIGPIYVSSEPIPIIDVSPETGFACVEEQVEICNVSLPGVMVSSSGCNEFNKFYWTITPNTGYTVQPGSDMGDGSDPNWFFWDDGSECLEVTFQEFGTYYIELHQANACGIVDILDSICIVAPIEADFTTDVISGCSPLEINTTNLPYTPSCIDNDAVYLWNVISNSLGVCPTEGTLPDYVNGTSSGSFEPSFLFPSPGLYEIELTATLTNPIPGTLCEADVQTIQVSVTQGPNMDFDSYAVCENDPIQLTNTVEDCYAQSTDFEWIFNAPPASIPTSNNQEPTVIYSDSGTFPVSVQVTNECGSEVFNTSVIVYPTPEVVISGENALCINAIANLTANITGPATAGTWSVSPSVAGLVPNGLTAVFNPPLNYTGELTFTFVTTDAPDECGQVTATFALTYEDEAQADAGNDMNVCFNSSISLNGTIGGAASSLTWSDDVGGTFSDPTSPTSTYSPPVGYNGDIVITLTTDDPPGVCTSASDQILVSVVQPPVISLVSDNELCQGTSIPVEATVTGFHSGVLWSSPDGSFPPGATLLNSEFAPSPSFNGITTITVSTTGAAPCPNDTQTLDITVHPAPFVADETLTICNGGNFDFTPSNDPPNSVPANTQYTWVAVPNTDILGATSQATAANSLVQTLTNSSNVVATQVYEIQPIATSALNCQGVPFTLSVEVIPTPVFDSPGSPEFCSGQTVDLQFEGVATNYSWEHDNTAIGLNDLSGSGDLNFLAPQVFSTITSNFTVTPEYTFNGVTCAGNPGNFTLAVISAPEVDPISDLVYCNNENAPSVIFNSSTAGSTFTWENDNVTIGLGADGTGNTPAFLTSNTTGASIEIAEISVFATYNGCVGPEIDFQIEVYPSVAVTNSTLSDTLCTGGTSNAISWFSSADANLTTEYSWSIANTGTAISGFVPNGNGDLPSFGPLNLPSGATTPGELVVTVVPSVDNCDGEPFTYTIVVNPLPILSPIDAQVICGGEVFNTPNFASNVPGTIFNWTLLDPNDVPATLTGYPTFGEGDLTGVVVNNIGELPYTLQYEVLPSASNCLGSPQIFSLTVNPAPSIIFSEPNQTICSGENTLPVEVSSNTPDVNISWTLPTVPTFTTGFNVTSGTTLIPGYTLTNASPNDLEIEAVFQAQATTTSGNACPGPIFEYTITINPNPTVSGVDDVLACNGQSVDPIVFQGTGNGYQWTVTGASIGLDDNQGLATPTFTATNPAPANEPIVGNVLVTPVFTGNNVECPGNTTNFNITVNPSGQVNPIDDITVCNGVNVPTINFSTNNIGGVTSYSWSNSGQNAGFGFTGSNVNSIPNFPATNIPPAVTTANVTVTPNYSSGGLSCSGPTESFLVNVIPTPTITPVSNQVYCNGDSTVLTNFVGTATGFTWTNDNEDIGLDPNGIGGIEPFLATNTESTPISGSIFVTPIFEADNLICSGTATNFNITVNTVPLANPVDDIVVCNGSVINTINFSGVADAYSWTFSGANIGNPTNFGTGSIPSFTAQTGTAIVNVVPEFTTNGLTCFGDTMTFQIIVNPTPTVNIVDNITICSDFEQPQIDFSGTGTSYDWVASTNPVLVGDIPANGTDFIPAFTSIDTPSGVSNQFTVTPIFTGNGLSCSGSTMSFGIQVLLNPTVNQLPDLEICNGECVDAIPFVGTGSSYVWSNTNTFIGVGDNGFGMSFPDFCGTNSNPLLQPISGTIAYYPRYSENNVTCNGDTLSFEIIVNPTPSVDPIDSIILCDGSNSNPIVITGNATTYSWQIDNPSVGVGLSDSGSDVIPVIVGNNATNNVTNDAIITITPEFDGSDLSCPGLPYELNVIVNPIPVIEMVSDQTLCFASPSDEVIFEGTGTSYVWNVTGNPSVGIVDSSGVDTLAAFLSENPTDLPISNVVDATPVFTTGNVSCFGAPTEFEIFVLPNPTIDTVPVASYCNQEPTNEVFYDGVFTSNTWSVAVNTNLGINAVLTGNDDLPSFTWNNTDNANQHAAVVTATPFYTFNGLTCEGDEAVHNIDILPTTTVVQLPDLTFCNGDFSAEFPIDATGTEISWNANPDVGITSGTTYFIPDFTATNLDVTQNALTVTSTVSITPSYTDTLGLTCAGTISEFDITVHPTPVITPISDYTVCNFGTVIQNLSTNIDANISWSSSFNAFIGGNSTTIQNSNTISEGLTNQSPTPGSPQQTTYSVNAVSVPHGCVADTMSFVVNLMPTVVMTSPGNYEICSGNQVGAIFESNVASTYTWQATDNQFVTGETLMPVTSTFISDILINESEINQIVTYIVTPTSQDGQCLGASQTIFVTVTPPPALVSSPTMSICSGDVVNYAFASNTAATYTWFGQNNPNVEGITLSTTQGPFITDQLVNTTGIPQFVNYTVIITALAAGANCSSQPIPITITVNPTPVVQPLTAEICPNETVTFILQASEPSFFTWNAENNINVTGETTTPTQSNFIQNTLTNNTYDPQFVYYNVTPTSSSTGCVGQTVQHTAIVNPLPNLAFEMSEFLCTENPVSFTIEPTTPLNVLWDLGNLQQSNIYNPTTFYEEPGDYIITLYGVNPVTGCENTTFTPISILLAPPVDFVTSSTKECIPALFQFTNTAENPGSILLWDFGDGTTSNEQGVTDHYYQEAGCYDVTLTATAPNGCPNSITYEEMVCAYNIPIAGFIVNESIQYADVNEFLFENLTVFGHTYHWDFGDGTTTNAVHPGHIYPMERNIYNVTLVATNEAGCSDTTMLSVQVKERLIFYVPNTFTPDGNGRNDIFQPVFTLGYDIYSYELMIFNRWGEPMFESYNDKVGWDGTYGGQVAQEGTYIWRIRFRLLDDEENQEYFGHVNLLK